MTEKEKKRREKIERDFKLLVLACLDKLLSPHTYSPHDSYPRKEMKELAERIRKEET